MVPKLLHDAEPVLCPNFVFHPIEMILHRLFRQTKMIRNLLVRKSFRNQRNNLLLPPRQTQPLRRAPKRQSRFRILKKSKQRRAKLTGTHRPSRMNILDCPCHILRRSIPPQVPADARANVWQKFAIFLRRPNQQDLEPRRSLSNRRYLLKVSRRILPGNQHKHVHRTANRTPEVRATIVLPNHYYQVLVFTQNSAERFSNELILSQNIGANFRNYRRSARRQRHGRRGRRSRRPFVRAHGLLPRALQS
jgi:hypothetical protein